MVIAVTYYFMSNIQHHIKLKSINIVISLRTLHLEPKYVGECVIYNNV